MIIVESSKIVLAKFVIFKIGVNARLSPLILSKLLVQSFDCSNLLVWYCFRIVDLRVIIA